MFNVQKYENRNWNAIHKLWMYLFSQFPQIVSHLACDTPITKCVFDQLSHKVLNFYVPAVQPYHNEPGGEEEKKGAIKCLIIVFWLISKILFIKSSIL